jgi:hypothetical protein
VPTPFLLAERKLHMTVNDIHDLPLAEALVELPS